MENEERWGKGEGREEKRKRWEMRGWWEGVCCGSNIVGNGDTNVCKQDKMINH